LEEKNETEPQTLWPLSNQVAAQHPHPRRNAVTAVIAGKTFGDYRRKPHRRADILLGGQVHFHIQVARSPMAGQGKCYLLRLPDNRTRLSPGQDQKL